MKQAHSILALTVIASAILTGRRFATVAGAVGTAGNTALGVARSDAAIGAPVAVDVLGTAAVEAGGEITAGQFIAVGANGKAVAYADGDVCVGQAAPGETAAGDGSILEVLLLPSGPLQVVE